jgi:hypothetical protein
LAGPYGLVSILISHDPQNLDYSLIGHVGAILFLKMNRRILVFLVAIVAGVVLVSSFTVVMLRPVASARPPPLALWAYTANWSCSNATSPSQAESIGLVTGEYETRISILNPSPSANVTLNGSFVESIARGSTPNVIFKWRSQALNWTIEPGASVWIDCNTLSSLLHF